jgi:anti-anti-sigma factor
MELLCRLTTVGPSAVLQVSGELDMATLPLLRDHLARAVDEHRGATVWVDLDGVTALDDTCLGMLLGAAGRAREAGGDLALVCTAERLRQRFALTGLDRAVTVAATLPR